MGTFREDRDADEHRREELLLDAVGGEPVRRAAARARLASDPDDARALRSLEARLTEARAELEAVPGWTAAHEERLIERVLAATTRAAPPLPSAPRGWTLAGWRLVSA